MNKLAQIGIIIVAVIAVAVADVLTKKVAFNVSSFGAALRNPLMLAVVALYLVQIALFLYVFVKKAELGTVGIIQTTLFAIIVLGSGLLFFGETMTLTKAIGILLAVVGVVLIGL
jgi:drug/metabolite transporter (DMT)-like permease